MANDWKERLGVVFSTNPDFQYETDSKDEATTLPPEKQNLKVWLDRLKGGQFVPFISLYQLEEGRLGVVVTFMAVLELIKEQLIDLVQTEPFAPIHVKVRTDDSTSA